MGSVTRTGVRRLWFCLALIYWLLLQRVTRRTIQQLEQEEEQRNTALNYVTQNLHTSTSVDV